VQAEQALHYSRELHRQQQAQLRQRQEEAEAQRHSEEAEYLQHLAAYHQQQQQHQHQQHPQHQYYPMSSEDLQHFPTHPPGLLHEHRLTAHDHRQCTTPPPPTPLEAYSHNLNHHHPQQPMRFLVEGEMSPTTIKFESPSLLLTPPLLPLE
jgi:hypothetical protein